MKIEKQTEFKQSHKRHGRRYSIPERYQERAMDIRKDTANY